MQASEEEVRYVVLGNLNSEMVAKMSEDFEAQMKLNQESDVEHEGYEESVIDDDVEMGEEEEEEDEEEEFSFMCEGGRTSPIAAEDAFMDGQIKPMFPLFNRDLLFSGEDSKVLHENLPVKPPVKKVFVETNDEAKVTSSSTENDEVAGPCCEWSRKAVEASAEVCKKSNSTGFSRIWRFKEFMGRSNSDGRDAFVFLNNNNATPSPEAPTGRKEEKCGAKKQSTAKVNANATINTKKVQKGGRSRKPAALSAHEKYMKDKAKDEDRRRSYLPYRPELMGFFTNVNGGLTRNVHPF